ncbi:MAG: hypothetical protein ABR969_02045 [Sedimentisphaerales bacterium]
MTISKYYCPSCGKRISWIQSWKFANWAGAGFRKSSPCPHCGKLLIWSKWPWRMIITGSFIGGVLLLTRLLFPKIEATKDLNIIFLIISLLMLLGLFTAKLEVSDSDKRKEAQ